MLDIAESGPMAPASASASPTLEPKVEEQIAIQVPKELCPSKPEEATHLVGELDLVQGRFPSIPPGFAQLTCELDPYRFGKGNTPRGTIRSLLPGVTAGNYLPLPCSQGGMLWVPIPGKNSDVTVIAPVQTPGTILLPSKDPGTLSKHNALPSTHEQLHCSSIP